MIVVAEKNGVAPFLLTHKHEAAPFLINQKCGGAPFPETQNAELINFCDDYIIERFLIHFKEYLRINRCDSEFWVTTFIDTKKWSDAVYLSYENFLVFAFSHLFLKLIEKPIVSFCSAINPF